METEQPERSELESYRLGDLSLASWHARLITDQQTGASIRHLIVPDSRYGSTCEQAAWWAVAAQAAYSHVADATNTPESFEYFMALAVNDDASIYALVYDFRSVLPKDLDDLLDWERASEGWEWLSGCK
jgi:hypothetical protein